MAAPTAWICLLMFCGLIVLNNGQMELNGRFLEERHQDNMWLIEFYAPWCGHCKKLEPVYREVAQKLRSTPVHVGKLDCTQYPGVASEFGVKGFPTIMFIHGDKKYTHRGDRTVADITEFAYRLQGPTLRHVPSIGKLNEAKALHGEGSFFLYIQDKDPDDEMWKKYDSIANEFIVQGYFYYGFDKVLPPEVKIKKVPTLLVFKDNTYYEFEAPNGAATYEALRDWVKKERLPALPTVSSAGLNEIADCGKNLVIIVDAKDDSTHRLKTLSRTLTTEYHAEFHDGFQFAVMEDMDSVNAITLSFKSGPAVLVLDPDTQLFYTPPSLEPDSFGLQQFRHFLNDMRDGRLPAQGGMGFFMRVKRVGYDLVSTLLGIWQASRWLFALMFGLPTIIISVICYSLCCMDPIEDEAMADEEDEDSCDSDERKDPQHEKAD